MASFGRIDSAPVLECGARKLVHDPARIAGLVDFLARAPPPGDRRVNSASLTTPERQLQPRREGRLRPQRQPGNRFGLLHQGLRSPGVDAKSARQWVTHSTSPLGPARLKPALSLSRRRCELNGRSLRGAGHRQPQSRMIQFTVATSHEQLHLLRDRIERRHVSGDLTR